jgi:hypothetical protein
MVVQDDDLTKKKEQKYYHSNGDLPELLGGVLIFSFFVLLDEFFTHIRDD